MPQIDYKNLMTLGKEELYTHVIGTTGAFGGPIVPVAVQPLDSAHVAEDPPPEGQPVQDAAPDAATPNNDVEARVRNIMEGALESLSTSPLPTLGGAQNRNPEQYLSNTEQVMALLDWANGLEDSEDW